MSEEDAIPGSAGTSARGWCPSGDDDRHFVFSVSMIVVLVFQLIEGARGSGRGGVDGGVKWEVSHVDRRDDAVSYCSNGRLGGGRWRICRASRGDRFVGFFFPKEDFEFRFIVVWVGC